MSVHLQENMGLQGQIGYISMGPNKKTFVHNIVNIFLSIKLNVCFGRSKAPSL